MIDWQALHRLERNAGQDIENVHVHLVPRNGRTVDAAIQEKVAA